jgi:prepilin-type processing-associated H-X9-DG protein
LGASPATKLLPYGWADMLDPYLKSVQVLQCPSEKYKPAASPSSAVGFTSYTDYAYNSVLVPAIPGLPVTDYTGIHKSQLTFAYNTVVVQDSQPASSICCDGNSSRFAGTAEHLNGSNADRTPHHLEGNNFLFADGHVKWFKPGKIKTGASGCAGGVNAPNGDTASFCFN